MFQTIIFIVGYNSENGIAKFKMSKTKYKGTRYAHRALAKL